MLKGKAADTPSIIKIHGRVLVKVPRLGNRTTVDFDVKRIGIAEITHFHGLNPRSKNAL